MATTLELPDEESQTIVAKALRLYETRTLRDLERCRFSQSQRVAINTEAAIYARSELDKIGELIEQVGAAPNLEERQKVEAWVSEGRSMV